MSITSNLSANISWFYFVVVVVVVVVVAIRLLVVVTHIRPQQLPMVDWARTVRKLKLAFFWVRRRLDTGVHVSPESGLGNLTNG